MKNIIKPSFSDVYMRNIQDEMNKIMEDAFGSVELFDLANDKKLWRPPLEMSETESEYDIKLQLPGFDMKDINIEVGQDYINVRAENTFEKEHRKKNLYRSEFRYGNFMRTVSFPSHINTDKTVAEFKDGVLSIKAPKALLRDKVKKLEVKESKLQKVKANKLKAVKPQKKQMKKIKKTKA